MKFLFQVRIDIAHNYENPCRSIKMMLINDIDAWSGEGFENFLLIVIFVKSCHFSEKFRLLKKMKFFIQKSILRHSKQLQKIERIEKKRKSRE